MKNKVLAEIKIELKEINGCVNLETTCFGELVHFAEIAQILKENKIDNTQLILLMSTILEEVKNKKEVL